MVNGELHIHVERGRKSGTFGFLCATLTWGEEDASRLIRPQLTLFMWSQEVWTTNRSWSGKKVRQLGAYEEFSQ